VTEKRTRQGLRDLGNNSRVRRSQVVFVCPHIWEDHVGLDHLTEEMTRYRRCGLCQEVRR
jgi:hypothetical protein